MVGIVLHNNPDPKNVPCHRVVNRDGKVAAGYKFGGAVAQRERLLAEGVKFRDNWYVDLRHLSWKNKA